MPKSFNAAIGRIGPTVTDDRLYSVVLCHYWSPSFNNAFTSSSTSTRNAATSDSRIASISLSRSPAGCRAIDCLASVDQSSQSRTTAYQRKPSAIAFGVYICVQPDLFSALLCVCRVRALNLYAPIMPYKAVRAGVRANNGRMLIQPHLSTSWPVTKL
jgi:hypothetical protein